MFKKEQIDINKKIPCDKFSFDEDEAEDIL
jgi:hypothetical protein